MKKTLILTTLLLSVALFAGDNPPKAKAVAAFEKMKTLVGEWQAKTPDGKVHHASYKLVAGGTCVEETFRMGNNESQTMVTIYHLDGDQLMLTHYCVANNQPRMRATQISDDVKNVTFDFVDATNLPDANAGHMYKAVFNFHDDGRFNAAWTFRKDGKDAFTESESYERVK